MRRRKALWARLLGEVLVEHSSGRSSRDRDRPGDAVPDRPDDGQGTECQDGNDHVHECVSEHVVSYGCLSIIGGVKSTKRQRRKAL